MSTLFEDEDDNLDRDDATFAYDDLYDVDWDFDFEEDEESCE